MRDIGKNIRDIRLRQNMTQDELAEKLFVTRQTVSNYETGRSRPSIDILIQLAEILRTDVNTVIYGMPADAGRRKNNIRSCVAAAITLLMGIAAYLVGTYGYAHKAATYDTRCYALAMLLLTPVFCLLLGWTIMQILSSLVAWKPLSRPLRKWILAGSFCVLLAVTVLSLSVCFPFLSFLRKIYFTLNHTSPFTPLKATNLLFLTGITLRFCDFPRFGN